MVRCWFVLDDLEMGYKVVAHPSTIGVVSAILVLGSINGVRGAFAYGRFVGRPNPPHSDTNGEFSWRDIILVIVGGLFLLLSVADTLMKGT